MQWGLLPNDQEPAQRLKRRRQGGSRRGAGLSMKQINNARLINIVLFRFSRFFTEQTLDTGTTQA